MMPHENEPPLGSLFGALKNALEMRPQLVIRVSFAIAVALAITLTLVLGPGTRGSQLPEIKVAAGMISDRDVLADKSITYVDKAATKLRAESEAGLVAPIFIVDRRTAEAAIMKLHSFMDLIRSLGSGSLAPNTAYLQVNSAFPGMFSRAFIEGLLRMPLREQVFIYSDTILRSWFDQGIVAIPSTGLEAYNQDYVEVHSISDGKSIKTEIPSPTMLTLQRLDSRLADEAISRHMGSNVFSMVTVITKTFAAENCIFDPDQSSRQLLAAKSRVEPVVRTIQNGERIIKKGSVVTQADIEAISAIREGSMRIEWSKVYLAIGILLLSAGMAFILLGKTPAQKSLSYKQILALLCTAFGWFVIAIVLERFLEIPALRLALFMPSALIGLVMASLLKETLVILFSVVLALLGQSVAGIDVRYFIFSLSSMIGATFLIRNAVSRVDFVKAGAILAIAQAAIGVALSASDSIGASSFVMSGIIGAINGFACALFALALIPVLEQLFNVATRFRLMELSDLNAPILKRLLTVAPGTYTHSMVVANLAESASRLIGADPLLARAGACYHDIGKIEQPDYFVENQSGANRYSDMSPQAYATVIRSHIKIGAEKARALRLPREIVDIIAQHHGNSLIEYFYNAACKKDINPNRSDYSYQSIPPVSKEAAIVMLADSIEASSRTLKQVNPSIIDIHIRQIFLQKIKDGQLDDCDLTFKDMDNIRIAFARILAGYFNTRIKYPKRTATPR